MEPQWTCKTECRAASALVLSITYRSQLEGIDKHRTAKICVMKCGYVKEVFYTNAQNIDHDEKKQETFANYF